MIRDRTDFVISALWVFGMNILILSAVVSKDPRVATMVALGICSWLAVSILQRNQNKKKSGE